MIQVILWDIDGTLLNFSAAERNALHSGFQHFGLGVCSDQQLVRYSVLNDSYWKRLERGEITKAELLPGRFREFFETEGIAFSEYHAFNDYYQIMLGDTIVFQDDGYALVRDLAGKVKQYAVTNGTLAAQSRKLKNSGLGELLDGAFISEQIGAEKPSPRFFDAVFRGIPPYSKDEIMIVGDSLTSDMKGGTLAGIRCCWYDPIGRDLPEALDIEFHIRDLNEVREIVRVENGG